jgi:hypothetical protein
MIPAKTELAIPNTKEIDTKANQALEASRAVLIVSRETYAVAANFLRDLKAIEKAINETFDPVIKAAHDAHKAALGAKAKHAEPIVAAEHIVKAKMLVYQGEEEKRAKEEEARLRKAAQEAEEVERLKRAEDLLAEGKAEEALVLLEGDTVEDGPMVHHVERVALPGIIQKKVWKAEVYDFKALLKAVLEQEAPERLIMANMPEINKLVGALGETLKIPGIRLKQEDQIAVRG